jgi:hypothetical protein
MTRITGTLRGDQYTFFIKSLSVLGMINVSEKSFRKNQTSLFIFSKFFSKAVNFMRKCRKIFRVWQATDDNTAHAYFELDTKRYTHARARTHAHTLRLCNSYWFSTATIVARTLLSVKLYLHCLSCFIFKLLRRA